MRKIDIWQSNSTAPRTTKDLWFDGNNLMKFGSNGWENIVNIDTPEVELLTEATTSKAGLVKQAIKESQLKKDAELGDVINKLNAVIVKLQAAGIMA